MSSKCSTSRSSTVG